MGKTELRSNNKEANTNKEVEIKIGDIEMMLYLSGPMTGLPDYNYPAFRKASQELRSRGFTVFDPSECFDGDQGLPKETYMREDIKAVLNACLIVLLDGWENSEGARLEVEVAKACGIPQIAYDEIVKN